MIRLGGMSISRGLAILGILSEKQATILRMELEVLLDEENKRRVVSPIIPEIVAPFRTPPFAMGEFVKQNTEFIVNQIYWRLNRRYIKQDIRDYLAGIDAKLYADNASSFDANDYLRIEEKLEEKEDKIKPILPEKKSKGRHKEILKAGRKRAIEVNGVPFESIKQAERETGHSYDYLKEKTLKAIKQMQNSL